MQVFATWLAAGVLLCAGATAAGAQTQPNTAANQNDRNGQPQTETPDQRGQTPQEGTSTAPDGSLSHDLSRSKGVIEPPPTEDKEMAHPPPKAGPQSTPVIPPPGSPGGNPKVQPK